MSKEAKCGDAGSGLLTSKGEGAREQRTTSEIKSNFLNAFKMRNNQTTRFHCGRCLPLVRLITASANIERAPSRALYSIAPTSSTAHRDPMACARYARSPRHHHKLPRSAVQGASRALRRLRGANNHSACNHCHGEGRQRLVTEIMSQRARRGCYYHHVVNGRRQGCPKSHFGAQREALRYKGFLSETQPVGALVAIARTIEQEKVMPRFKEVFSEKSLRTTVNSFAARGH